MAVAELIREESDNRTATIVGDNPAVMRHLASAGRIHDPQLAEELNRALQQLAVRGWNVTWLLSPRQANSAAHEQAQAAREWARVLANQGATAAQTRRA